MCDFVKEDVIKIAKAVVDKPFIYEEDERERSYYCCKYCEIRFNYDTMDFDNAKHEIDCPVLVARDILTRAKEA